MPRRNPRPRRASVSTGTRWEALAGDDLLVEIEAEAVIGAAGGG